MNGHVVARDHRLRRKIDVLLAQIDRRDATARVGPIDSPWLIHERHQNIQTACCNFAEAAQPFNQHHRCLWHNLDRLRRDDQQHDADEE